MANPKAIFDTNKGQFTAEIFREEMPITAEKVALAVTGKDES